MSKPMTIKPSVATKWSAHATSAIMAGLAVLAFQRQFAAEQGRFDSITPDQFVIWATAPTLAFAAVFILGHHLLSNVGQNSRLIYSAMGIAAIMAAFFLSVAGDLLQEIMAKGLLSVALGIMAVAGAMIGFLHVRSAGFEFRDEEIEDFERAHHSANPPRRSDGTAVYATNHAASESVVLQSEGGEEAAYVAAQHEEYFEGPLQVITSGKSVFIAAATGGMVFAVWQMLMGLVFSGFSQRTMTRFSENVLGEGSLQMMGFGLLSSILLCLFALSPVIYGTHLIARARGKIDIRDYAIYGALAPILIGLAMFIVGVFVTYQFIPSMAISMVVYRKLAGLEPADLPEDIEARDRRALVGANHARRRYRRIVG